VEFDSPREPARRVRLSAAALPFATLAGVGSSGASVSGRFRTYRRLRTLCASQGSANRRQHSFATVTGPEWGGVVSATDIRPHVSPKASGPVFFGSGEMR